MRVVVKPKGKGEGKDTLAHNVIPIYDIARTEPDVGDSGGRNYDDG